MDVSDRLPRGAAETDDWFRAIYSHYGNWLRARLVRRYGAQDADDLFQETWLRLAPYGTAGSIRHPKALLLRIAANLASDGHARRSRAAAYASDFARAGGSGVHQAVQADEVFARQVILGLPQPLRDRIVVGEMRDGAAALETLKSWNTGHPGGLSTIHANSADDVLRRIEDLIAEVSTRTPRRAIAQAVDRIVHIRRTATGRQVEAVLGVEPSGDDAYAISVLA